VEPFFIIVLEIGEYQETLCLRNISRTGARVCKTFSQKKSENSFQILLVMTCIAELFKDLSEKPLEKNNVYF
jgi:hypothetical protein